MNLKESFFSSEYSLSRRDKINDITGVVLSKNS